MKKVNSQSSMLDIERTGSKNSIVDLVDFFNQEHFRQSTEIDKLTNNINYKLDNIYEQLNTINDFIRSDKIIKDKIDELRNQYTTITILLVIVIFICLF